MIESGLVDQVQDQAVSDPFLLELSIPIQTESWSSAFWHQTDVTESLKILAKIGLTFVLKVDSAISEGGRAAGTVGNQESLSVFISDSFKDFFLFALLSSCVLCIVQQ